MSKTWVLIAALACGGFWASAADAACPKKVPNFAWALDAKDQRVTGSYVSDKVKGKKVTFKEGGTENYLADGGYFFKLGSDKWVARGVKFYENGVRCIDYPRAPRFDLYVENKKKLVLINQYNERFVARVR